MDDIDFDVPVVNSGDVSPPSSAPFEAPHENALMTLGD
jgi:hypothetical protein